MSLAGGPETSEPGLIALRPGPLATIQDLGRQGHRAKGVPLGGAFDLEALEFANTLVGNPPDAAALELTLTGGLFRAEVPLRLALAGAPMDVRRRAADGPCRALPMPTAFDLRVDDLLEIGGGPVGARAYLAVAGGWRTPEALGSRSDEAPLQADHRLPAAPGPRLGSVQRLDINWLDRSPTASSPAVVRVLDGPDAGLAAEPDWTAAVYRVAGDSDRVGLRLEGPAPRFELDPERLSAPVIPGTVQATGETLIILGPACGTMGGYPQIAHALTADLGRLAQLRPGDLLRFQRIDLQGARLADRRWIQERRHRFLRLQAACEAASTLGRRGLSCF